MKIGISGLSSGRNGHPKRIVENAQTAEQLGFDLFTLPDTQSLKRELFSCLGPVADNTESISIGPMVTNPVTRHPVVVASAMCTISQLSGGRAYLGIASGDSAVRTLGRSPARLAEMESIIELFHSLFSGEAGTYEDTTVELDWVDEEEVPIIWAAEGPKTQTMAGSVADGVLLGLGVLPELIDSQLDRVAAGAESARRDLDDVETWVMARCNVADTRDAAIDELKPSLAAVAHHSLQFSMEEKGVPEEYIEPLETLLERYESDEHNVPGGVNRTLLDELDVTEYLVDRYAVVGTPGDCIEQLAALQEHDAIDGVFLAPPSDRRGEVIRRLGEDVLPEIA